MIEKIEQQNLLIRVLVLYGLMLIYSGMRLTMDTGNEIISRYPMVFFIIDILTFLIFSIYIIRTFRLPIKGKFFTPKNLLLLSLGIIFVFLYGNVEFWLGSQGFFPPDMNSAGVNGFIQSLPVAGFFFVNIMAPVMEESIHRGVFFQLFFQKESKWRPFLQILISGLIFGSLHVQAGEFAWQNLLNYSIMGWALGTIYCFSKDLKTNILIHFFNNAAIQFIPGIFTILFR
ncbi:MAG: CPBP family intramembrane metalloprotease [Streptococcaceae bacterium]|nr:CPBP family intramembrane metalloprotease [Streptococcaceae bacterium]